MYHLAIKPISRSAGRSATAAAAYRAGSVVVDERTGEVHDYTRKGDIEHSEIMVPAGSPAWATERVALWNAAEAAEKRKDARVARDYEVAIPKELSREQGIALVRDFAHRLVDAYGVAVDFNVHRDELRCWDGSEKGWQGYHAHLLTSTRQLGRDGFGEKASIELSDTKRKSLGLADGAAEIARVREWWEIDANRHLEQASQAQRIDRRSLKDQGIDREPTVHLGPAVTLLERDGVASRLGDLNRQIVAEARTRLAQQREVSELRVEIEAVEARQAAERREAERTEAEAKARPDQRPVKPGRPAADAERSPREAPAKTDVSRDIAAKSLGQLILERDQRVLQVLAKAEQREARRRQSQQGLLRAAPVVPRGVLAAFQQKGHQQALAAWNAAKATAAKLAEQAKQLVMRLKEIAAPERILAWSRAKVESAKAPEPAVTRKPSVERGNEPTQLRSVISPRAPESARAVPPAKVAPPAPALDHTKLSIQDQVSVFQSITERLEADRVGKLKLVEQKALKRHQRRERFVEQVERSWPARPKGLLAGFKQKAYEDALIIRYQRLESAKQLSDQSAKLNGQLEAAKILAWKWAEKIVAKKAPELHRNVQLYSQEQRRKQFEKQWAEQEAKRSRDRNRGWER